MSKADIDGLIGRLRRGEVEGRKAWTPRSCNYLRYLVGTVLDDQVKQGNVTRNVGKMVDRIAGEPQKFRTLTAGEVAKVMAHDWRDRHAWALALCGLRRGEISGLRWEHVNLTEKPADDLPARSIRTQRTGSRSAGRSRPDRRSRVLAVESYRFPMTWSTY